MNIKLVLYFIIVILGLFLTSFDGAKGNGRKWYVFIIISLLVLESCLRNVLVGPDTIHYYTSFVKVSNQSWDNLLGAFSSVYSEGEGKDPGFLIFMKACQILSLDFNVFLFLCALPFFIPLGIILYRYSTSVLQLMFAFTLYVALFNIVALSGIRQQIATGLCFVSFLQLDKGKLIPAILLILLGATIHISTLVFLSIPVLRYLSPQIIKSFHLFSFATIPFIIVFAAPIILLLASILANDYYSGYAESESSESSAKYIIMMELLSLFCFIFISKSQIARNERTRLLYCMLPMLTMTAPLISLNGVMIRIGQYFTMYMMLLVPRAIDSMSKGSTRYLLYFGMIVILILMSMRGGDFKYYFFWQSVI